jgi:hypothetical protein
MDQSDHYGGFGLYFRWGKIGRRMGSTGLEYKSKQVYDNLMKRRRSIV